MARLKKFIKNQDAFGKPVKINYKGQETYKTFYGGCLTLAHKIFILIVALLGLIDLVAYEDPNVTQF